MFCVEPNGLEAGGNRINIAFQRSKVFEDLSDFLIELSIVPLLVMYAETLPIHSRFRLYTDHSPHIALSHIYLSFWVHNNNWQKAVTQNSGAGNRYQSLIGLRR